MWERDPIQASVKVSFAEITLRLQFNLKGPQLLI